MRKIGYCAVALALMSYCVCEGSSIPTTDPSLPAISWFHGDRYLWRNPFTWERYDKLCKKLPAQQRQAFDNLMKLDLVPLDLAQGSDHPRLPYILAEPTRERINIYATFPMIDYLDLYRAKIDDEDLPRLGPCVARSLTLPAKGISDGGVRKLLQMQEALPNLQHLEIEATDKLTSNTLGAISLRETRLRSLQLSGLGVNNDWIRAILDAKGIHGLRLYDTAVTDEDLAQLCRAERLTHLSLTYCRNLTSKGLKALKRLPQLTELHLVGKTFDDAALEIVKDHPTVEILALESSSITPQGIKSLASMPRLRVLVILVARDDGVNNAAEEWQKGDPGKRRLYLNPDVYLGGWVEGLVGQWVNLRGYLPTIMP
ncbi:MAG TPA: hypothetical protein VHP11_11810 [Tepidisphaeraceae bacterium]|nr:hypothetical protein [Tepidisphaeraceae bacterium]